MTFFLASCTVCWLKAKACYHRVGQDARIIQMRITAHTYKLSLLKGTYVVALVSTVNTKSDK